MVFMKGCIVGGVARWRGAITPHPVQTAESMEDVAAANTGHIN